MVPIASRFRPAHIPMYSNLELDSDTVGPGILKILRSEGHRIRELRARLSLLETTSFDACDLRFCSLKVPGRWTDSPTFLLFNGHTPRLEALLIRGTYFLPANTFSSLTHLILDHYRELTVSFTFKEFMQFL